MSIPYLVGYGPRRFREMNELFWVVVSRFTNHRTIVAAERHSHRLVPKLFEFLGAYGKQNVPRPSESGQGHGRLPKFPGARVADVLLPSCGHTGLYSLAPMGPADGRIFTAKHGAELSETTEMPQE